MNNQTGKTQVAPTVTVERVSILLDGEMDRDEAGAAIGALCSDAELRRHWHELHRAGDALRSDEVAALDAVDFCSRVSACIAAEPTVLAPAPSSRRSGVKERATPTGVIRRGLSRSKPSEYTSAPAWSIVQPRPIAWTGCWA